MARMHFDHYRRNDNAAPGANYVAPQKFQHFQHLMTRIAQHHGSKGAAYDACGINASKWSIAVRTKKLSTTNAQRILTEYNRIKGEK